MCAKAWPTVFCCYAWASKKIYLSICHIYKLVYMHMTQLFQYKYLIWTCYNEHCDQKCWYTYISQYWHLPLNNYACLIVHMSQCTTIVVHIETTQYISKNIQFLFTMLLLYMYQEQKCHSNATYDISSCEDMRQLYQYIYLIWTQCNQQCDQKQWYTYIWHYWQMQLRNIRHEFYMYVCMYV